MEIKENDELGLKFPIVKKKETKPTIRGFLRFLKVRLYLCLPVRKRELYEYLHNVALLVQAVKELESINRTQITGLLYQVNDMKNEGSAKEEKKEENPNYRGQYQ